MSKIFDYFNWRGDLSQTACPFSEVDIACFTQLVYLDFNGLLLDKSSSLTIKQLYKKYESLNVIEKNVGLIISNKAKYMFREMARLPRYKNLVVSDFVCEKCHEKTMQFRAFSIKLNHNEKLVIFSGTDDSIVGWEENFAMTYVDSTASAKRSVSYLKGVADSVDKLIVAGHSKGGYLAMYSLLYSTKAVSDKIQSVYAFDSPGFTETLSDKKQENSSYKIYEFAPQNSVFGRIFNHYGSMKVVQSSFKGMFQHDIFSWDIKANKFVLADGFSKISDAVDNKIKNILSDMSTEDKKRLAKLSFEVLYATGAKTLTELSLKKLELIRCYLKMNSEDKKFLKSILVWDFFRDKNVRSLFMMDMSDKEAQAVFKNSKKYAIIEVQASKKKSKKTKRSK